MKNRHVVVANGIDGLHQIHYRFWFDDSRLCLVLDAYVEMEKETRDHGWRDVRSWQLFWPRDNNVRREEIVIPEEIRQLALKEFRERITVE